MDALPGSVAELIGWLDSNIPEQRPAPGEAMENIMFYAGQRAVVNDLKEWLERSRRPFDGDQ